MHWSDGLQQSDAVLHNSYSLEHPPGGGTHSSGPPSPAGRQKPLQHWSPELHGWPFPLHGGSTQNPRRLSAVVS